MAQHEDEEEEEKMLKMNTSLEGKAGLNLQKQKAIKTQFKIWDNNQPTGGRQEEILAQNDDASSAEKEAGLNLQKGKTKITHAQTPNNETLRRHSGKETG